MNKEVRYYDITLSLPVCKSYKQFLTVYKERLQSSFICHELCQLKQAKYHPRYCMRLQKTINALMQGSRTLFQYLQHLFENNLITCDPYENSMSARQEFLAILIAMPYNELTRNTSLEDIRKAIATASETK